MDLGVDFTGPSSWPSGEALKQQGRGSQEALGWSLGRMQVGHGGGVWNAGSRTKGPGAGASRASGFPGQEVEHYTALEWHRILGEERLSGLAHGQAGRDFEAAERKSSREAPGQDAGETRQPLSSGVRSETLDRIQGVCRPCLCPRQTLARRFL